MKALMIPPEPETDRFGHGDMHLVLAHLMQEQNRYTRHYRRQADAGAHIILDNSAFELGESAKTMDELIDMACWVKAKEVVVPDAMQDRFRTEELVRDAINAMVLRPAFFKRELVPMYVAQGVDYLEWKLCLKSIMWMHLDAFGEHVPAAFGVSRVYEKEFLVHGGRARLACDIRDLALKTFQAECPIHLLGWGEPMKQLPEVAVQCPWIRSIDSSAPYRYAIKNAVISVDDDPGRVDDYFEWRLSTAEAHLAKINETIFVAAANGHWPSR